MHGLTGLNKMLFDSLWQFVFGVDGGSGLAAVMKIIYNSGFDINGLTLILNMQQFFDGIGLPISNLCSVIYTFAYYLLILKFVKKIFDIYGLETDGDSNMELSTLVTNFCKAMVISLSFTVIYDWLTDIVLDFGSQLMDAVSFMNADNITASMETIGNTYPGTVMLLLVPVYMILVVILVVIQLKMGLELWVLRLGAPLACTGLLDADKGVFKTYSSLILRSFLTIITQFLFIGLSLLIVSVIPTGNMDMATLLLVLAGACVIAAIKTPSLFSDLLIPRQGGGGRLTSYVYMASMFLR